MVKVFFDTNFFLRYLLKDHPQSEQCLDLMREVQKGSIAPYTSAIVFLELNYVLTSQRLYHLSKVQAGKKIQKILQIRNLVILEETNLKKALVLYQQKNIKLADCLIALQVPEKAICCTFDREFQRIDGLDIQTPEAIVAKLK